MKKTIMLELICICISLLVIIPILVYAGCSVPAADDYTNAIGVKQYWDQYSSTFIGSFVKSYDFYLDTSGYFYAVFLNFFFSPFLRWGISGVRVFNIISNIVFFAAVFFLFYSFICTLLKQSRIIMWFMYSMFIYMLVNGFNNSEIYTWYCVQVGYILPLSSALCASSCFILWISGKKGFCIPGFVLTFLASGSSLNVVALNCGLSLLLSGYAFINLDKKKESVLFFLTSILGAIINVIAPGNYIRHDSISPDYNIIKTLLDTLYATLRQIFFKTTATPFLIFGIILFVICMRYIDYTNLKFVFFNPFLAGVMVVLSVIIVNFPVCLGYSSRYISDRAVFIQDVPLFLLSFFWIFYFVGWLKVKKKRAIHFSTRSIISVGFVMVIILISIYIQPRGRQYLTTCRMIEAISSGKLYNHVIYEEEMIEEMKTSNESNLVLIRNSKEEIPYFMDIGITKDPDHWINRGLAEYYGKESISIKYAE